MKRTRRQTINIDSDNMAAGNDHPTKKSKKDSSTGHNNISKSSKNDEKNSNISNNTKNNNDKEYETYLGEIQDNLTKFEAKPKFTYKKYDTNNKIIKKMKTIADFAIATPIELYYKYKFEENKKISNEEDKCSICLYHFYEEDLKKKTVEEVLKINDELRDNYDVVLFDNCSDHFFHLECMDNMIGDKEFIKCPICNVIYGMYTGDQPKGTMKVDIHNDYPCAGYEKCNTIVINYDFPNGKNYTGTGRTAYLPDNKEGREVLALFKIAFDRKLLFTVGTSVTTGATNTTVWNGVHQKTNTHGGSSHFGYPDPTYFNRVKEELAAKGVTENTIKNMGETVDSIVEGLLPQKKSNKKKNKK